MKSTASFLIDSAGLLIAVIVLPIAFPLMLVWAVAMVLTEEAVARLSSHKRKRERAKKERCRDTCPAKLSCKVLLDCETRECPNWETCLRAVLW